MKYIAFAIIILVESVSAQTWSFKVPTSTTVLGNALAVNPLNSNIVYGAPGGRTLYLSRDRGYTWHGFGNPVSQIGLSDNTIKSIAVNELDTLQILVGVEAGGGGNDRVMKSTNGGTSWTQTWSGSFSYYGKPVEYKTEHPDTVYTMDDTNLWRSIDFGSTWTLVRSTSGLFSAWCDAELRPDSGSVMYLGDFSSGIWKTADYGVTWKPVYSTTGEIPSIAIDPFNPRVAYATKFSGGGGVVKSTDWGESWHTLTTPLGGGPGWWITCSKVSPGYVYFGVYGADMTNACIFVSADSGSSWRRMKNGLTSLGQINYGLLALDTLTVIASQYNGIWRLQYPTVIQVTSPNGGEIWQAGTQHPITWIDSGIYAVKIEFSTNNGTSWTMIADSIPAAESSYVWTIPGIATAACRVRISDAYFTSTRDTSDASTTLFVDPLTLFTPQGGEVWDVTSTHAIDWVAHNLDTVKLEFSTDSGATWNDIARVPASLQSYNWLIPDAPSNRCKVRISSNSDSALFRMSPSLFTISSVRSYSTILHIHDHGAGNDSLTFGAYAGATDSIDPSYGEAALPPKPSPGVFDVRWKFFTEEESKIDIRDTLSDSHRENVYRLELQPGPGGYPMTISWKQDSLRAGIYILRDTLTHGSVYNVDMRADSMLVVSDSTAVLEIIECLGNIVTYSGSGEWELISVPVDVGDRRKSTMFPYSLSKAFTYVGGYQSKDTVSPGVGYWLKMGEAHIIGSPRERDTFNINTGWNIVGSVALPVAVSSLTTEPDTLLSSDFFGYASGYFIADSLVPGRGYWIKARSPGAIIAVQGASAQPKMVPQSSDLRQFHSLTFGDGQSHAQTLYIGEQREGMSVSPHEMPPLPPHGTFDVRFGSQRSVEVIPQNFTNSLALPILLSFPSKKIFFSWGVENERKFSYILSEKDGDRELLQIQLEGRGSRVLETTDHATFVLKVQKLIISTETPREYSLGEMYPNPFNPKTNCNFSVPVDAHVTITVYSIIGERVATLVDDVRHAGVYQIEWNGTNSGGNSVSSGVYCVRMTATPERSNGDREFSGVRRVVLLR